MDLQSELLESGKATSNKAAGKPLASLGVHGGLIALILFISTQATQKVAAEDKSAPRVSVVESGSAAPSASTPSAGCVACGLDTENREAGTGHAPDIRAAARDPEGNPQS